MKRGIAGGKASWRGLGLQALVPSEMDRIHSASLEVLCYSGIDMFCREALEILADSGADVDFTAQRVRIPPYLVEECIDSAPSAIILAGRNPKQDVYLGGNRVHFTTFGAGTRVVDLETGAIHLSTKTDVANSALISDALESVDIYSGAIVANDMPQESAELHEAEAFLLNTTKHCQHLHLSDGYKARKFFEMGAILAGGWDNLKQRPIISSMVCPSSPLQFHKGTCEIIIESAKASIPVNILSMAMSGATAPVTLAGTLVIHNAEVLAGIVLHQLTNKGAPVIYGSSSTGFNMHSLTAPVGSPELALISSAVAQLARFYLLPSWVAGT